MRISEYIAAMLLLLAASCSKAQPQQSDILPITGSWVNLAYQDVRNKYTNPTDVDMTDPELWRAKVREWKGMGLEMLVIMQVANECKSFYPSKVMPPAYPEGRESPVEAIMDEASKQGLKVFMSTGWARDQFENLRDPWVQERQQVIMEELTGLFASSPAFYGWYLPVEDCITPVFPKSAVEAVNILVERAHQLTPGKKTLISPYGMVRAEYDNPALAENIRSLKVDIVAYQDEVGCVREPWPLPRLKENWKKLRAIHEGTSIEMWANCETFTWERETNSLYSALIPAAYERLLSQQIAASEGGVERIISFMFGGIIEDPSSQYSLGQGEESARLFKDYMAWKGGCEKWRKMEKSLRGMLKGGAALSAASDPRLTDGELGGQAPDTLAWVAYPAGETEIVLALDGPKKVENLYIRCLDYALGGILPPSRITVYDGDNLIAIKQFTPCSNNNHDVWIDAVEIPCRPVTTSSLKVKFTSEAKTFIDEIYVNI